MSKKDIKVPNIGEFKDVEVIEVLIKKGQKIKKNLERILKQLLYLIANLMI